MTIALFCLTVFSAEVIYRLFLRGPHSIVHTFSYKVRKPVTPDSVVLKLTRAEPFEESMTSGLKTVRGSVNRLRQDLEGDTGLFLTADQVLFNAGSLITRVGVAPFVAVKLSVEVELTDLAKTHDVISRALASGFNEIEVTDQRVSDKVWTAARQEAIKEAQQAIRAYADQAAVGLGINIVKCGLPTAWVNVPPGDPALGAGSSSIDASDVVPIESLIRPLRSLVEPEPEFKGSVFVAPTVALRPVDVTGEARLSCELTI